MKLSKMELKALADDIRQTLEAEDARLRKAHFEQQDKNNLAGAKIILRQLQKLPAHLKAEMRYGADKYDSRPIEEVDIPFLLKGLRQPFEAPFSVPGKWDDEIFNRLVIGQIDSPDVQALIAKVTKQYIP